jgi:hypothetical protein
MILNIIDRRKRRYRWACIDVILKAKFHDSSCPDSDQAPVLELRDEKHVIYEQRDSISLTEALKWASGAECPVTLFLYDQGSKRHAVYD